MISISTVARTTSKDVGTATVASVAFELVDKRTSANGNTAIRVGNDTTIATTVATTLAKLATIRADALKLVN